MNNEELIILNTIVKHLKGINESLEKIKEEYIKR